MKIKPGRRCGLTVYFVGPLLLWMILVWATSTRLGAYEQSLNLMIRVVHSLSPESPVPGSGDLMPLFPSNNALRKLAHVFAFAVFMLLAVRAIQWGNPRLKPAAIFVACLLGTFFAGSDAVIRYLTPMRHVREDQFVLDAIGAAFILVITVLYFVAKSWERACLPTYELRNYSADRAVPYEVD
jgi:VanZ family protein